VHLHIEKNPVLNSHFILAVVRRLFAKAMQQNRELVSLKYFLDGHHQWIRPEFFGLGLSSGFGLQAKAFLGF
jgi:hypothetical protein